MPSARSAVGKGNFRKGLGGKHILGKALMDGAVTVTTETAGEIVEYPVDFPPDTKAFVLLVPGFTFSETPNEATGHGDISRVRDWVSRSLLSLFR